MKVHLRQRKQVSKDQISTITKAVNGKTRQKKLRSSGQISLYLEIYKGTTTTPDGKTKVLRDYKYLNLYLIDKPVTPLEKQQNKDVLQLANAIKAKTELEIKNGQYGFEDSKSNVNFLDFLDKQANKNRSDGNKKNWLNLKNHLVNFAGNTVPLHKVTSEFCEQFKDYLNHLTYSTDKKMSPNTVGGYISTLKTALNLAVKEKLVKDNPVKDVAKPKRVEKSKEYLTFKELQDIAKTECNNNTLKRAFLFSCLTGLRWSDIEKLKWSEIQDNRLVFHQKKTTDIVYMDIPKQAITLLGQPGQPDDRVFNGLIGYSNYINLALQNWLSRAGITKKITFHCGRHTFAVLQLTYGTDIYTVSKLLGHSSIKTTEVYAKIVDSKKKEAANRIPDIGL